MRREYHSYQDHYESMKDFTIKVFKTKSASITSFLKLLQTHQLKNQPVKEFAREIRVRAYDFLHSFLSMHIFSLEKGGVTAESS